MSVESPKRSWRTSQARSTNPPISSWSVRAPRSSASSKLINGGMHQIYERVRTTRLRPALLRQPARWPLVPGEVLDDLRIAGEPPSEDEDLEVGVARLECPDDRGADADRIERTDVDHLIVELELPAAREDHVDLLRLAVLVCERLALARLDHLVGEAGVLGAHILVGEARLQGLGEPRFCRDILRLAQVLDRVVHSGRAYTLPGCSRHWQRSRSRSPPPPRMSSSPGLA